MVVLNGKRKRFFILLLCLTLNFSLKGQQIVDSCFVSVDELGQFLGSEDLKNVCICSDPYISSNLMEWNPNTNEWMGRLPHNTTVDLPPPPLDGCFTRGLWIGSESWTAYGEAFALRLDAPLESGKTYSYTFTYAADGYDSDDGFEPIISTCGIASLFFSTPIDTLPPAFDNNQWITNTSTFTATASQNGHTWLIVHAIEESGTILSNCKNKSPLKEVQLSRDTVLCVNDAFELQAQTGTDFQYQWNTGATESSIAVQMPGEYSVAVGYKYCEVNDTIQVKPIDCEVRLIMPNVFTPNDDEFNPVFVPIKYNFIQAGKTRILNRWGTEIFRGDLFEGWNGKVNDDDAPTGVYFYQILFDDPKGKSYESKGIISLSR